MWSFVIFSQPEVKYNPCDIKVKVWNLHTMAEEGKNILEAPIVNIRINLIIQGSVTYICIHTIGLEFISQYLGRREPLICFSRNNVAYCGSSADVINHSTTSSTVQLYTAMYKVRKHLVTDNQNHQVFVKLIIM